MTQTGQPPPRPTQPGSPDEPICELCSEPISRHVAFHRGEPADVDRLVEGRFPGMLTRGVYCPRGATDTAS